MAHNLCYTTLVRAEAALLVWLFVDCSLTKISAAWKVNTFLCGADFCAQLFLLSSCFDTREKRTFVYISASDLPNHADTLKRANFYAVTFSFPLPLKFLADVCGFDQVYTALANEGDLLQPPA